jgi:hypothetical protein
MNDCKLVQYWDRSDIITFKGGRFLFVIIFSNENKYGG